MTTQFRIALPSPQTPSSMKPSSRRTPLTPSTITPPQMNVHTTSAKRLSVDTGSPPSATALLSRVVAHPSSRRSSPVTTPTTKTPGEQHGARTPSADQWQGVQRTDGGRYWTAQQQQDGYISFPDFEKYCQHYETTQQDTRQHAGAKG